MSDHYPPCEYIDDVLAPDHAFLRAARAMRANPSWPEPQHGMDRGRVSRRNATYAYVYDGDLVRGEFKCRS